MKNTTRQNRAAALLISPEEKRQYMLEIEQKNPGFMEENEKLTTIVRILTGIRILYGLFYAYVAYMFNMSVSQGIIILVSAFFFFVWYSWMLRSGKLIAVMMLLFRGIGITTAGASLIPMVYWLPFTLTFTLVTAIFMEFTEAIFCIYILFNKQAAHTIRLNRHMDMGLLKRRASRKLITELSGYKNEDSEDGEMSGDNEDRKEEIT